jgi:membrane protease YdiL (CAAX protease family)
MLIMAGMAVPGFLSQHATKSTGTASSGQLAGHGMAIHIYLAMIFMECALFYFCWSGVRSYGGTLRTLSGGRWSSWKDIIADLAIVLPFWLLWEGIAYAVQWLLGASDAKSISDLLPQSLLEIILWIVLSIAAGVCEEIAFRGYLQQQLHAVSGSATAAVLGQAVLFGMAHSYQGWKQVIAISVLGVPFGMLAVWRNNLRANMIAHAWADIWEGWLKALL